jgi:hypothetical protein
MSTILAISALIKAGIHLIIVLIHIFFIFKAMKKWKNKSFKSFDDVEKYIKSNYYYNTSINIILSFVTAVLLGILAIKHYYF